jgi:prevent-host-death family protein
LSENSKARIYWKARYNQDWSFKLVKTMETIQASEAKTHFLRILDKVERGETVVVTRHGRAIARICPEAPTSKERFERAKASIMEIRKRTKPVSVEEILSARDEGRM